YAVKVYVLSIDISRRLAVKASEGKIGRVFVIRLEDGDVVPECIESFAREYKISVGQLIMLGGIGSGEVVVGPRRSDEMPPEPMLLPLDGAHEVVGAGTIVPDEKGEPVVHIHAALGRAGKTTTGCLRPGVNTWLVGEVIIYEILGTNAVRITDKKSGIKLLNMLSQTKT
ncbi:MAG: DNA-binding protein, partial [Dehalococcoidales bacterium]|nr:DNA-binding protein [Dehalococcoidales bacterium]